MGVSIRGGDGRRCGSGRVYLVLSEDVAKGAGAVLQGRDGSGMQRFAPAQVYDEWKHLVDQKLTDGANRGVPSGVATDYPAPRPVNDEVGEIRKRKNIAILDFAITKPGLTSRMPRLQVPSRNKVGALEAPGKTHMDCIPVRRRLQRRELRNGHVRDDL